MTTKLRLLAAFSLLTSSYLPAQTPVFDTTSYKMPQPAHWQKEIFPIPIDFAPAIPYTGQEELRFAPGWADSTSAQYWSYAFVWFINGKPDVTAEGLQEELQQYYTGLIGRNIEKRKIPKEILFPVTANIRGVERRSADHQSFAGEVHMLDYMRQRAMVLHFTIEIRPCTPDHTAVLFTASPADSGAPIRQQLQAIVSEFECRK